LKSTKEIKKNTKECKKTKELLNHKSSKASESLVQVPIHKRNQMKFYIYKRIKHKNVQKKNNLI